MLRRKIRRSVATAGSYGLSVAVPLIPSRKFFIVCPGRTGSELLVDLLDSHPSIRCEGELFKDPPPQPLRYATGRAVLARLRRESAWGCKILDHHFMWHDSRFGGTTEFFRRAKAAGWTLVRLRRRDLLAQSLSVLHARRDQYHYREGEQAGFTPFVVDPAELITMLFTVRGNAAWMAERIDPYVDVQVVYEDDLRDGDRQQATVDRIATELGVPVAPVTSQLRTVAPVRPADRVDNWEQVSTALRAAGLGSYLSE